MSTQNAELADRLRVVDMMLSAHARLRDSYQRRALFLDLSQLLLSGILVSTTFLDPQIVRLMGLTTEGARVLSGAATILLFLLAIVGLRVDWAGAAERHSHAAATLATIKSRLRQHSSDLSSDSSSKTTQGLLSEIGAVIGSLPPIPESKFLALKAYHSRKVLISRAISAAPGTPLWLLRLRTMIAELRRKPVAAVTSKSEAADAD